MKRFATMLLALSLTAMAFGQDDNAVTYLGGTATLKPGASGTLDTTGASAISLSTTSGTLTVPYANITEYNYSREVARHLGIVAATIVPLVRKRERRHYLTLQFRDADQKPQTAVLEIPKQMPRILLPVLLGKQPSACKQHDQYYMCPGNATTASVWPSASTNPPVRTVRPATPARMNGVSIASIK